MPCGVPRRSSRQVDGGTILQPVAFDSVRSFRGPFETITRCDTRDPATRSIGALATTTKLISGDTCGAAPSSWVSSKIATNNLSVVFATFALGFALPLLERLE